MTTLSGWRRLLRVGGTKWLLLAVAVLGLAVKAWATPPVGFIVNEILASAFAADSVNQHVQINRNPDGSLTPWQLGLQVQGDTDYYSQHLVLSAGGYSGWHSHPGLLIAGLKSGQVDFYDGNCNKRTITPGQVYTEDDNVHAIINTGGVDADLYISYLIKHGQARRRDEAAPPCAIYTPIP